MSLTIPLANLMLCWPHTHTHTRRHVEPHTYAGHSVARVTHTLHVHIDTNKGTRQHRRPNQPEWLPGPPTLCKGYLSGDLSVRRRLKQHKEWVIKGTHTWVTPQTALIILTHTQTLTASSSPLRLGLPSASPNESSVGGSVASVGGSLTWEAEDLEGELCLGAGVGAVWEDEAESDVVSRHVVICERKEQTNKQKNSLRTSDEDNSLINNHRATFSRNK